VKLDVVTRCDQATLQPDTADSSAIRTSSVTAAGIAALRSAILAAVAKLPPRSSPATLRMTVGLDAASTAVAEARRLVGLSGVAGLPDEAVVAGCVRRAVESLGEVTGAEIGVDLLDRIFSRHCIGK